MTTAEYRTIVIAAGLGYVVAFVIWPSHKALLTVIGGLAGFVFVKELEKIA